MGEKKKSTIVSLIFLLQGNALYFKSARNVTVNILNEQTKVLTQLITGKKRRTQQGLVQAKHSSSRRKGE